MAHSTRYLTALPVFNEAENVTEVLDLVVQHAADVLVVDDGSTDGTSELLAKRNDIFRTVHPKNRGYGAALLTAFEFAIHHRYDVLVTIDCDGQHEPQRIESLVDACKGIDIVSGSRYLELPTDGSEAPAERRKINEQITAEINRRLGLELTDAFCGFKAYRVDALASLELFETGYAMPLELWVQAAHHQLTIREVSVPLIYLDETRSFGGDLDDGPIRLQHYYDVVDRAVQRIEDNHEDNHAERCDVHHATKNMPRPCSTRAKQVGCKNS